MELFPIEALPFAQLALWQLLLLFGIYFLGFFIRGAFGFGSNMPIVLLTTWILEPHHAILLVALAALIAQVHLLPQGIPTADRRVIGSLVFGMAAGVALGTWLFTLLQPRVLTLVLGVLIVAIVLMDRFRMMPRLGRWVDLRSRAVTTGLSVTSGTVGTVSGGGGIYFLVAYLAYACPDPTTLRGTNLLLSGIFMIIRALSLAIAGLFAWPMLVEVAVLLPAVFLGTWTGTRFFRAVSADRFYRALQLLLVCAALALIGKAVL